MEDIIRIRTLLYKYSTINFRCATPSQKYYNTTPDNAVQCDLIFIHRIVFVLLRTNTQSQCIISLEDMLVILSSASGIDWDMVVSKVKLNYLPVWYGRACTLLGVPQHRECYVLSRRLLHTPLSPCELCVTSPCHWTLIRVSSICINHESSR